MRIPNLPETALLLCLVIPASYRASAAETLDYLEDFTQAGQPSGPKGTTWSFTSNMRPGLGWAEICPGDGYAHITIDADLANDRGKKWPFQTISFSSVGPGHRLEMRARGAAVSGVGGFIFTYTEAGGLVDEIDIEIVPDDYGTPTKGHSTSPPDGWTDARFNTWGNASTETLKPARSIKKAIVGADGKKVSHDDARFHVYTIEWQHRGGKDGRDGHVAFLIDGVPQDTIARPVPDDPAEVILGFRHMSWTGPLKWPGTRSMLIDWFRITPLTDGSPAARADTYELSAQAGTVDVNAAKGVLANDEGKGARLQAALLSKPEHGTLDLAADGAFRYTPRTGFKGVDTFVYTARTEHGDSNAATVMLRVSP